LKDAIVTANMRKIPGILNQYKERGIGITTVDKFIEINKSKVGAN
jgi:hypothetical protein